MTGCKVRSLESATGGSVMLVNRISIVFLIILGGCLASPRRYYPPSTATPAAGTQSAPGSVGAQAQGAPSPGSASGNARQVLEQIDRHLSQQGYQRLGPAVHNPNMAPNGVVGYAIEGRAGLCYTIVAVAQAQADLNLVVTDAHGRTIGYNVNPDAHPWATVCPGAQGRFVARLDMARGGGEYYYAAYHGPQNVRPDLTAMLGGRAATTAQVAQIDAATQQRLAALDQSLGAEGFRRVAEPQGVVLQQREDRDFPLNLETTYCYAFGTLGGPGARDTDVFLIDGSGTELAREASTQIDSLLRFCPEQAGSYQLRTRMYTGEGPLFAVGYAQPRSGGSGTATNTPPPQTQVIAAQSVAAAGIEENFRLLDSDMRARGYEQYGDPARGQLNENATQDFALTLEGGKCYAILGVGDSGVRDLDLLLMDGGGQQLDHDMEADARPVVRVCPRTSGSFNMRVRAHAGGGSFVYAPYRWPRGIRGPFGLNGLIYLRLAEVTGLLDHEQFAPDINSDPGRGRIAQEGQTRTHNIRLQEGQCYAVLVVGGEGVTDLDAMLSNGNTTLAVESNSHNAFPSVRYCATGNDRVRLSVRAAGGSGEYFYQVFTRSSGG